MIFKYLTIISLWVFISCNNREGSYVCTPCELACDQLSFDKPGTCPHCNMLLIKKEELHKELVVNQIEILDGAGKFLIEGSSDKSKTVEVYYHKPKNFNIDSKVLLVLPGAGRNGGNYRDAWVEASNKYNVLILALVYSEKDYPGFWSYNLAGMIENVDIKKQTFDITRSESWIFNDFDRIFTAVKQEFSLTTDSYDMFGHSAGGQLLHRAALFNLPRQANRILASNSGWYTLPQDTMPFPYGLNGIDSPVSNIKFDSNLVLFLGEEDDLNEKRGHLRRSKEVDVQGLGRLERGKYFYNNSKEVAKLYNKAYHWKIEVTPGVGHDYKEMSKHAAEYLFNRVEK